MRKAQIQADRSQKYVAIFLRNQVTYVEPNTPPFSEQEIQDRLTRLLEEEQDELRDNESILSRPNKLSKKRQPIGN